MYGGGFATIPAYLADIFGTQFVGAIHGRLLTAWSAAGILGPVLVNYIREYQIDRGVPAAQAYNVTMYVLAGLLVVGFFCNLAVRPVDERYYMTEAELERERALLQGVRPGEPAERALHKITRRLNIDSAGGPRGRRGRWLRRRVRR